MFAGFLVYYVGMMTILPQKFFSRPTLKVAKELLGKFLVRKIGWKQITGMITEVEVYIGTKDRASHASRGRTERTKVMFGKAGYWYVYLIYGMHYCLNIVTEREGYPVAVLIRGIRVGDKTIKGPGRVCKFFKIDKQFNVKQANKKTGLWIEDRRVRAGSVKRGKRIGVDYAGEWRNKPWRFYV